MPWTIALSTISSIARHAEHEVGIALVLRDGGAGDRWAHERHLSWFTMGTMAIDTGVSSPPNSTATFHLKDQLARRAMPLARIAFVVAPHQHDLAAVQQAAARVDLVDGDRDAARQRFAGAPDSPDNAVIRPIMIEVRCQRRLRDEARGEKGGGGQRWHGEKNDE